jgi:hypothetical protein
MSSTRIVALTLTAAALAASGCGGSKPSSDASTQTSAQADTAAPRSTAPTSGSSTPSLTRDALIKKADAICARVNAKRSAITIRTPKDFATKLPGLATAERTADAALSRLVPPSAMAGDWAQILSASQALASDIAKIAADTTTNDANARRAAWSGANQAQHRLSALTTSDGFKVCGHAPR